MELEGIIVIHDRGTAPRGPAERIRKDVVRDFSRDCEAFVTSYREFAVQRYGEEIGDQIAQVVTEAAINIGNHANSGLPNFLMGVDTLERDGVLQIGFAHNGKRFNPQMLLYTNPQPMQKRGWGTRLMKEYCERILFAGNKGRTFYLEIDTSQKYTQ